MRSLCSFQNGNATRRASRDMLGIAVDAPPGRQARQMTAGASRAAAGKPAKIPLVPEREPERTSIPSLVM
jgi:hypothetical protein